MGYEVSKPRHKMMCKLSMFIWLFIKCLHVTSATGRKSPLIVIKAFCCRTRARKWERRIVFHLLDCSRGLGDLHHLHRDPAHTQRPQGDINILSLAPSLLGIFTMISVDKTLKIYCVDQCNVKSCTSMSHLKNTTGNMFLWHWAIQYKHASVKINVSSFMLCFIELNFWDFTKFHFI